MHQARLRLGQLLVDARILTPERLEQMLAVQKADGRRLGTLLVEGGLVTETQLTQILSQQLSVPWVSLYHIDFSRELLNRVPRDVAEKYCLVPIYVRPVRGQGDTLYVAMDDPQNEDALKECSQSSGLPARAMIASPSDIRKAIRLYYGGAAHSMPAARADVPTHPTRPEALAAPIAASSSAPSSDGPSSDEAPTVRRASTPAPEPPAPVVADVPAAPLPVSNKVVLDDAPVLEVREVDLRARKRKPQLSLTLLDGTTIRMPTAKKRAPGEATTQELTANDVIAALKAAAHGADAREVLGEDVRWEKMFAVLLKVLMKKHLVLDHEFMEELKKS